MEQQFLGKNVQQQGIFNHFFFAHIFSAINSPRKFLRENSLL